MSITVVLCTYNRCETLPKALNSVASSTLPNSVEWEVLIVDNNSNDQTRDVAGDFCRRYPGRFRYLLEPQQGLSCARNAGIRESRGDVLAFMDDDVTVDPAWLWNLTAALQSGEWAGAGGRVVLMWECLLPPWLSIEEATGPLAAFDLGCETVPLTEPPIGANMAFRKEMFEKYGGFRTDLGHCGNNMVSNEDTEFGNRLLIGGERLRYEPSAVVRHPVSVNRISKKYLLMWSFGKGRGDTAEFGIPPETIWCLGGIPLYLFRRLAAWTLRWMFAIKPSRRFYYQRKVWQIVGAISEYYRRSPAAKKRSGELR